MREPGDEPAAADGVLLEPGQRLQVLAYCGALLLLLNLAAPYAGLLGVPILFFLKNRLHLGAGQMAMFNLWVGIPLYLAFVFGFIRDRWSPFAAGDRGYLVLFGLATAAIYAVIAFVTPTYWPLLVGLLVVTCSIQFVASAANGLVSAIGQRRLMAGQASTVFNLASALPVVAAFLGGLLSERLEGEAALTAARILFLGAAGLMAAIAVLGLLGPGWLFAEARAPAVESGRVWSDVIRLLRHWPIYPPLAMLILWDFGPAIGTALQYHLANDLSATDTQVGAFYALFFAANLPTMLLYGWLCQRMRLSRLLLIGTLLAVLQMVPLFFVRSPQDALVAAVIMGLMGGLASAAYVDLAIRSCPPGLQATVMMLVVTVYWVAVRFGDLWGTYLYERGGYVTTIWASTGVYALILPLLLLAPRRLTATSDGEATPAPAGE